MTCLHRPKSNLWRAALQKPITMSQSSKIEQKKVQPAGLFGPEHPEGGFVEIEFKLDNQSKKAIIKQIDLENGRILDPPSRYFAKFDCVTKKNVFRSSHIPKN